jgi:outer membrane usher protein
VLHENRVIGRTDRNGRILVPELTAYTPNRIAIDPENLPIDARVVSTNARIVPYGRVGAKVDLRVQLDTQSALVELLDRTGAPLPAGSVVTVATGGKFVVGYDGLAFMDGLKATNRVTVTRPDGATCVASFAFKAARGEQVRIGGVRCAAS